MMTVGELIEQLESMDPAAEVRLAVQPSYPMQHHLDRVVEISDDDEDNDDDDDRRFNDEDVTTFVYLGEGGQVYDKPYLPGHVAAELGWR